MCIRDSPGLDCAQDGSVEEIHSRGKLAEQLLTCALVHCHKEAMLPSDNFPQRFQLGNAVEGTLTPTSIMMGVMITPTQIIESFNSNDFYDLLNQLGYLLQYL